MACPNAGFMTRLMALERELYGSSSISPAQVSAGAGWVPNESIMGP